jgi:hypothetical protein
VTLKIERLESLVSESMRQENDGEMELPGEITTVEDPLYSASLNYPMPGRPMKAMNKDEGKNTARVAPTVSENRRSLTKIKKTNEDEKTCEAL